MVKPVAQLSQARSLNFAKLFLLCRRHRDRQSAQRLAASTAKLLQSSMLDQVVSKTCACLLTPASYRDASEVNAAWQLTMQRRYGRQQGFLRLETLCVHVGSHQRP